MSIRENLILIVLDVKLNNLPKVFGDYFNFFPLLDLPTVEELMKPIRIDSFRVSGFDLQPVRYEVLEWVVWVVCLFFLSLETCRLVCST